MSAYADTAAYQQTQFVNLGPAPSTAPPPLPQPHQYAPTTRELVLRKANIGARSASDMNGEGPAALAIYESVKKQIVAEGIMPEETPRLIFLVVKLLNESKSMSKSEKKRIGMRLITVLVQDLVRTHASSMDVNYQNLIIDGTIATASSAIETALDIKNGGFTKETALMRLCNCLSAFAIKTASHRYNAKNPPSNP